ncbi:ABC transporter substrate-binding protein [Carnobacterium gallinarum]|uniref:ABC transporter substrate-binding protein n=1 Tax=Carnobacterium gallinarum TaxID=2749 RepID=UPI0005549F4F|nr:extracellular solute-binding protein [Carnobacterium gallinarum]
MYKKNIFKIGFISALALLIISGCSSSEKKADTEENEIEIAKVAYKENVLTLPDNIGEVMDVVVNEEKQLMFVGKDKKSQKVTLWKSLTNGDSWELVEDLTLKLEGINIEHMDIRLTDTNRGVIRTFIEGDSEESENQDHEESEHTHEEEQKVYFLATDFSITPASKEVNETVSHEQIQSLTWADDNQLIATGIDGTFLIDSQNGQAKSIFSKNELVLSYEMTKESGYFLTTEGMKSVDLKTGGENKLKSLFAKTATVLKSLESPSNSIFSFVGDNPDTIYLANQNDIMEVTQDKAKVLFSKNKTVLGDARNLLREVLSLENKQLLAVAITDEGSTLIRYEPTENNVKETKNILKIYALTEDEFMKKESVRQAISLYQKLHEDSEVILEIGVSDNEMSTDEALKVLNTKIASGDGPDILLLDGLNVDKYVEQGSLLDIFDVVKDNSTSENFTNVFSAYRDKDAYYGVPMTFSSMSLYGPQEIVDNTDSIEAFTASLIQLSKESKTPIFENWNFDYVATILYRTYLAQKEEDLKEGDIQLFYSSLKKLYQEVDMKPTTSKKLSETSILPVGRGNVDIVIAGEAQMAVDYIDNPYVIRGYELAEISQKQSVTFLKNKEKSYYIPQNILGVLKTSTRQDEAKQFISYALSQDVQSTINYSGIPINKEAFKTSLRELKSTGIEEIRTEAGGKVKVPFTGFDDEAITKWVTNFETLNTAVTADEVVFRILIQDMDKIMKGDLSVKDGVKNAIRKIKLYQAE